MNQGMAEPQAVEPAGTAVAARTCVKILGVVSAGRFAGAAGMLNQQIGKLDGAGGGGGEPAVEAAEDTTRSRSEHGAGFVLTMGDASRFPRGKHVASYVGLIPWEESSGGELGRSPSKAIWQTNGVPASPRMALSLTAPPFLSWGTLERNYQLKSPKGGSWESLATLRK